MIYLVLIPYTDKEATFCSDHILNKPNLGYFLKNLRKNPPFALFILAALSYIVASNLNYDTAWTWVSNFLWGGIILQIIWILMVVFSKIKK